MLKRIVTLGTITICLSHSYAEEPEKTKRTTSPLVRIETSLGAITVELNGEKAPLTVQNFLRYVEEGFYSGTIFHRVVKGSLIQGGAYSPDMVLRTEGVRQGVKSEAHNGLSHIRGTVGMARVRERHSATTQFFINLGDNSSRLDAPGFDGVGYTAFGKVTEGMDVVDRIGAVPVAAHQRYAAGKLPQVPVEPVLIQSVRLLSEIDFEALWSKADDLHKPLEKQVADLVRKFEEESGSKVVKSGSGLIYLDYRVGSGRPPTPAESVEIHYRGFFMNGVEFESTYDDTGPSTFKMIRIKPGLKEGLQTMKEGGRRKMIVSPDLAYGESGIPGVIPPNATLVFDVELLLVKPSSEDDN